MNIPSWKGHWRLAGTIRRVSWKRYLRMLGQSGRDILYLSSFCTLWQIPSSLLPFMTKLFEGITYTSQSKVAKLGACLRPCQAICEDKITFIRTLCLYLSSSLIGTVLMALAHQSNGGKNWSLGMNQGRNTKLNEW